MPVEFDVVIESVSQITLVFRLSLSTVSVVPLAITSINWCIVWNINVINNKDKYLTVVRYPPLTPILYLHRAHVSLTLSQLLLTQPALHYMYVYEYTTYLYLSPTLFLCYTGATPLQPTSISKMWLVSYKYFANI